MLLTITTTHKPATDLGYLLHKNPARAQVFELAFGQAHVFYPKATEGRCTAALLLDVDPVALVRGRKSGPESFALGQYVNERPYVVSSFMSNAISRVFGTAMGGRCSGKPELADLEIPLVAKLSVVPCRGGEDLLRRLFEPLGYSVAAEGYPLDDKFPDWGESAFFTVSLKKTCRLSELLTHLYVLIPVLDDEKHYWVGEDEVEKLLKHGEDWLSSHPEKDLIVKRYLRHRRNLMSQAMAQLMEEDSSDPDEVQKVASQEEWVIEERISLNEQRMGAVVAALRAIGAKRILDLGCGEGKLIGSLLKDKEFVEIVGVDVSYRTLERAQDRLRVEQMAPMQRERIKLLHGSLIYRDKRLEDYDAAAVVEVIEHMDLARLAAFERVLFEFARPGTVVLTTPNSEYNVKWESLPAGKMRHRDHRFEWTREEFQNWANGIGERFGYSVRFLPVGPEDAEVGAPTQMAVFERDAR
ncbi:MAG: 3' terminal RNA ribose 2'-O-methyltransferase Hen1 [Armatimonadota bacterium]|nr:3' terminal RNA ribose 2'-O-methyltransferase Hen1 [bacterium]